MLFEILDSIQILRAFQIMKARVKIGHATYTEGGENRGSHFESSTIPGLGC